METPERQYERRAARYDKLLHKQKKADRTISNLRLAVFSLGLGAAAALYFTHHYILSALLLAVATGLFIYLVLRHEKLSREIQYNTMLLNINTDSLKRLRGEWNTFADCGEEFNAHEHPYAGDLDIFGQDSLFQWTNTAKTHLGRDGLSKLLLGTVGNMEAIFARQEAVNELAAMLSWRQDFQAEAMLASGKLRNPDRIIAWAQEESRTFRKPWVIALVRVCPLTTAVLAVLGFALNVIPWMVPSLALLLQFGLLSFKAKERSKLFAIAENYCQDLRVYAQMLKHFEEREFTAPYIKNTQAGIRNREGVRAHRQIARLSSLIDALANRRNAFYLILNIVTLWDFQSIIALESWKQKSGSLMQSWFEALGQMEALSSLALIRFDHPSWAIPQLHPGKELHFKAKGLGHPLLTEPVHNDLALADKTKVLLITGSNMSGKSTLLRTAGINLVLAYSGAPVCAQSFSASIMEVYTCMRVRDNLSENISSFYAELLRIKEIVRRAEAGNKVFFLLDEVFKGTNSRDRHIGAKVLINKLSATNSIGLVSTHDLELCDLDRENKRIGNCHFQEYYQDGKIHFDYQLRPGPSNTSNALYLMRLAGIEVEEEWGNKPLTGEGKEPSRSGKKGGGVSV